MRPGFVFERRGWKDGVGVGQMEIFIGVRVSSTAAVLDVFFHFGHVFFVQKTAGPQKRHNLQPSRIRRINAVRQDARITRSRG